MKCSPHSRLKLRRYMNYKFWRSLLIIGLTLLIVAGLVLWVWLAVGAADGCISHIEPGQPDLPLCNTLYLPGVYR